MREITSEIRDYWNQRAAGYSDYNRQEMSDSRREQWRRTLLEQIGRYLPARNPSRIRILDAGCGPGFFSILLAEAGFSVTAIDCTENMLIEAGNLAGNLGNSISWFQGDVQELGFDDESFDIIVTRNVTWNLPDPEAAYREWYRVLKKDGFLLNFDADWYGYLFDEEKQAAWQEDRKNASRENREDCNVGINFDICEDIARRVPLSRRSRPSWDIQALKDAGFADVFCNEKIWQEVWSEDEKVSCASTPMFLLAAQKQNCKDRIVRYWNKRSEGFSSLKEAELHDDIARRWLDEITPLIPSGTSADGRRISILDAGCGAGFFSILLAREGYDVTGIDLSPAMISSAEDLARRELSPAMSSSAEDSSRREPSPEKQAEYNSGMDIPHEAGSCSFLVMDAEHPAFPEDSFDMIICRNLVWTLPHPEEAYASWLRLLRKGGTLLVFDANYGLADSTDTSNLPPLHAHHSLGDDMLRENDAITRQLPISFRNRPAWDLDYLSKAGAERFVIDTGVWKRIYLEKDIFYNPVPIFRLAAVKA